ncbi:hypothetical protein Celal_1267 [Cellulophaga algicola DSM 14237]|uniref:Lipoprotein n=2 Tax=Cellulophaga TaxID=104264 RepID=E6X7Y4_CELAD|nr:hypothetical protein Celal_1267 [Cellulophaga algicola DSM 14237]
MQFYRSMKQLLIFAFIVTFLACNSKQNNSTTEIKNENPKVQLQKKLNGKEVVDGLEELNYFILTDSLELDKVKADFEKAYTDLNFFQGPMRAETLDFMDNRYFWVDCEELFEVGGLTEYLGQVQRTFKKLGLQLEYGNEQSLQDQTNWKHTIEINGNEYAAFDGQFSDIDWGIAYVNFIEMLNVELKLQGSSEQFYPINCANDGSFVLLTVQQLSFVNSHYPNNMEHPTTMSNWKNGVGL